MRADFYLLEKSRFSEQPLLLVCELARKAHAGDQPTLILARDLPQAEEIDDLLWAFDADAFIPHQIAGADDDDEAAVLIVPPGAETAARALVINLRDEATVMDCQRVLEVVPTDPGARDLSRARWKSYRARGAEPQAHKM